MTGMAPWRKIAIGAVTLLALPIASWVAGYIFLWRLDADTTLATPFTFPEFFYQARLHEPFQKAFTLSWLGAFATFLIPVAIAVETLRPRILQHGSARFASFMEIRNAGLLAKTGIIIGRLGSHYLRTKGNTHVILSAPTRTGKGVGVVIPNLLSWSDSTVTLDVKGENYAVTAGFRSKHGISCYFFNPVAEDGRTHRYNPLGYISDKPAQRITDIQKIASFLFPAVDGQDPIWSASASGLFLGVVLFIIETPGLPLTMGEVLRQVTKTEEAGKYFARVIEERETTAEPFSQSCVMALADFISTSTNTRTSIRKTFTSRLQLWNNPQVDLATSDNDFDLSALRRRPMSVYFGVTPDNLDLLAPLTNLFFQQALDLNTRVLPEQDPALKGQVLFILDEFANFGAMNLVMKGISYVGGYGLRLLTILQSPAQLNAIYGDDRARTYFTNNAIKIHFRPSDDRDAETLSKALGTQTFKAKSRSRQFGMRGGGSDSTSDQARPLMLPQELRQLGDRDSIIQADGLRYPMKVAKILYYKEPAFKERLLPPPEIPILILPLATIPAAVEGRPALAIAATAASLLPADALASFRQNLRETAHSSSDPAIVTARCKEHANALLHTILLETPVETPANNDSTTPTVEEIIKTAGSYVADFIVATAAEPQTLDEAFAENPYA